MNFDPNTGEPIQNDNLVSNNNGTTPENNTVVENIPPQPVQPGFSQPEPVQQESIHPEPVIDTPNMANTTIDEQVNAQESVRGIPTVEQNDQSFVANTQAISSEKKSDDKSKVNYALILILLAVVVIAIFFVFPLLKNIF